MAEVIRLETRRRGAWRRAVGGVLREWRTDRGLRLSDVAQRAGVSMQYLSEVERGRKEASSEVLGAVTDALGSSLSELALGVADELGAAPRCGAHRSLDALREAPLGGEPDGLREPPLRRELRSLDGLREGPPPEGLRSVEAPAPTRRGVRGSVTLLAA